MSSRRASGNGAGVALQNGGGDGDIVVNFPRTRLSELRSEEEEEVEEEVFNFLIDIEPIKIFTFSRSRTASDGWG